MNERVANLSGEECEVMQTAAIVGVPQLAHQLQRLGLVESDELALRLARYLRPGLMDPREAERLKEERKRRGDAA